MNNFLALILILGLVSIGLGKQMEAEIDDMMVETTKTTMESIRLGIDMYYVTYFQYPDSIEDIVEFLEPPSIPLDAWGNPFVFERTDSGDEKFIIYSYGADGKPGGTGYDADIFFSREK